MRDICNRLRVRSLLLAGLGLLVSSAAMPCDMFCAAAKPERILKSHRYVMIGRVTKAQWDGPAGTFTVVAIRVWRGGRKELVLTTQGGGASCGYVMEEGRAYVVYANADRQSITTCDFVPIPAYAAAQAIAYFDKASRLPPLSLPRGDLEVPR
jgi:hypothetical protein